MRSDLMTKAARIVAAAEWQPGDDRRELIAEILRAGGREVYNANDWQSLGNFYPTMIWELPDGSRIKSTYATLEAN